MRHRIAGRDLARRLASHATALPGLLGVGVFLALAASEAGFYPTTWYPAALFLLAALVTATSVLGLPRRVPALTLTAIAALTGYVAWGYLSITWADQAGAAWDGANRAAMYLVVLALMALWPIGFRAARVLLAVFGLGMAVVGLAALLRAGSAADPSGFFIDGRLIEPAGYVNANAALWSLALWPCLFLASTRSAHPVLRGLCLGGAGLLSALALMSQSRGWLFALPVATVLFVVLAPGRVRRLTAVAAVAAGTYAVAGRVLAIRDPLDPAGIVPRLDEATPVVLAMAAVLALAGAAVALADRRFEPAPRLARAARAAAVAALALAIAGAAVAFTVREGSPAVAASEAWEEFKRGGQPEDVGGSDPEGSRLSSVSTNRFDFWTVAWGRFRAHPLTGIGIDNFQQAYLQLGTAEEQPRYAHSLQLGVLSQTGIVGAALLATAVATALAAALRAVWHGTRLRAGAAGAATTVFAYWFVHGSVDWFWEFPGLAAPAFGMLGLATALGSRQQGEAPRARGAGRGRLPRPATAVAMVVAVAAACALAVSFVLPWTAARGVQRAIETWRAQPEAAFERLERAAALNPLASEPYLVAGTIALRLDRPEAAARAFRSALQREPRNAYASLELGAIASARGERRAALEHLERAVELSPRDVVYRRALARVRAGERVLPSRINERILERARALVAA